MSIPLPAVSPSSLRNALGWLINWGHDLTPRQLCLLIDCATLGPQTVRDVAARLGVSKPSITRAADRLASAALLRREPDPADRRSVHLVASDKGRGLVLHLMIAHGSAA